ncbi:MAG: nucleotidyl transferase AbiEii/AbiGii toxin family protein [Muribaculaceae bacterium]
MKETREAQSIKARILNIARGDNKTYQQLIVRFFHERILYRLSKSKYREHLILKGGSLLYAFEEFTPRPTIDIDFAGKAIDNNKSNIIRVFREITSMETPEDGIEFQTDTITAQDITIEKEYPGVRISLVGRIGTYRQQLTMDVGFGDIIVPGPIEILYPTIISSMEEPQIMAYSLETVIAEKFQTVIERGRFNSRMKDYFDLYRIITVHKFDKNQIREAILATLKNRNTIITDDNDFFDNAFSEDIQLNRQWNNYKRRLNIELPTFKEIHNTISGYILSCLSGNFS